MCCVKKFRLKEKEYQDRLPRRMPFILRHCDIKELFFLSPY